MISLSSSRCLFLHGPVLTVVVMCDGPLEWVVTVKDEGRRVAK